MRLEIIMHGSILGSTVLNHNRTPFAAPWSVMYGAATKAANTRSIVIFHIFFDKMPDCILISILQAQTVLMLHNII